METGYSNQQATLRIRVALPEDSGHYTLLSENPQGCTVSSAYLAIEPGDQIDQVPYQAHQREFIQTQQMESTTESTDAGKTLPPNFVRTCTDKEATEGKMTRYVVSILSSSITFRFSFSFLRLDCSRYDPGNNIHDIKTDIIIIIIIRKDNKA